jgi:preprotein translocase subunit SecF
MFSFYKTRRWFFALSALLMAVGILTAVFAGVEMDITFRGEQSQVRFHCTIDLEQADDAIGKAIGRPSPADRDSLGDQATSRVSTSPATKPAAGEHDPA